MLEGLRLSNVEIVSNLQTTDSMSVLITVREYGGLVSCPILYITLKLLSSDSHGSVPVQRLSAVHPTFHVSDFSHGTPPRTTSGDM